MTTSGRRAGAIVEAQGLVKRFGPRTVVDHVGFVLERGTVTALLGPNGAGKTTTMRLLLGLARPDEGRALFDGLPYRRLAAPLRHVGAMLDDAGFHRGRRARDELRILVAAGGLPDSRVGTVLAEVGLAEQGHERVGSFSTGMRQRLGLAAALLGDPPVLLLDEPSLGLDPAGQVWLRQRLVQHVRGGGTVLVSSHLLGDVEQVADRVLVLDHGRLVADAALQDFVKAVRADVLVEAADPDAFEAALLARGALVRRDGGVLRVRGMAGSEVGQLASDTGLTLYGLREDASRLEEAFLAVTADGPQPRPGDSARGRQP